MKAGKLITILGLGALAAGGFWYATKKTNGGKGTAQVGGHDYRVQIIPDRSGGYTGVVVIDGVPQDATVGPMPTVAELEQQISTYLAGLDVDAFYTTSVDANGVFYFDGWSRGEKVAPHQGPYATEQVATAAGSEWARKAAVPVPA